MDYYELRDDLDDPPFQHPDELSPIQKVYEGACIFITGATGFMGKVIMEKLLRTCNVGHIYILVRDKRGVKSQERLISIFDDLFFEPLKLQKPGEVAKVSIITGDCSQPDLGLSEVDKARLSDVNIIFHAAATLYMDQHLKVAYITNVLATKYLLEFAKTLPRLQAFMYISTAYSHPYKSLVEETFYDMSLDEEELGEICNKLDDAQIGALTPKLTGRWLNTYVLTKACTENLISKYDGILPIGIVRPSIVVSTWTEPLQGWINNVYGTIGVVAGTGLGILRVWGVDPDAVGDMMPVDISTNMIIAATWEVVTSYTEIKIYNCVSSTKNPMNWSMLQTTVFRANDLEKLNPSKAIAAPSLMLEKNKTKWYLYTMWYHVIPAVFFDMVLKLTGKPPQLLKLYCKIFTTNSLFRPYGWANTVFTTDNVDQLWNSLNSTDKTLFNFDLKSLDWNYFWLQAARGIRLYIINDPMETLPEGRKHAFKLKVRKYVFDSLVWTGITYILYFVLKDSVFSLFVK